MILTCIPIDNPDVGVNVDVGGTNMNVAVGVNVSVGANVGVYVSVKVRPGAGVSGWRVNVLVGAEESVCTAVGDGSGSNNL